MEQVKAQKRLITTSQNVTRSLTGMDGGGGRRGLTKEDLAKPVTYKSLELIMDGILSDLDKPLRALNERIKALEARVAELEARPQLRDAGTWDAREGFSRPETWRRSTAPRGFATRRTPTRGRGRATAPGG